MRPLELPVCMHQLLLALAVGTQINELLYKAGLGLGCDALRMINLDAPQMALQGDTIRLTCSFRLANDDEFGGSRQDDEKSRFVDQHPSERARGRGSHRADKRLATPEGGHTLPGKSSQNLSTSRGGRAQWTRRRRRRRRRHSLAIDSSSEQWSETLYAVKWYKDEREFYQFITRNWPHRHALPMSGLNIDVDKSDNQTVVLRNVSLKTSGLFRCEVSTDAPSFLTKSIERKIFIYSLPAEGPTIETSPPRARSSQLNLYLGDQLEFRCLSRESKPQTQLDWIINERVNLTATATEISASGVHGLEVTSRRFVKMPKIGPARETAPKADGLIPSNDTPTTGAITHELIEAQDGGGTVARSLDAPGLSSPLAASALDQLPETSMSVLNFTVNADFILYLQTLATANGQRSGGSHWQKWPAQKLVASSPPPDSATSSGSSFKTRTAANGGGDQRKLRPASKQFNGGHGWPLDVRCVARVMHLSMSDAIRFRVLNSSRGALRSTSSLSEARRQERRTGESNSGVPSNSNFSRWIATLFVAWTLSQGLFFTLTSQPSRPT